jgi:ribose-phosphate pyrophosphokinase
VLSGKAVERIEASPLNSLVVTDTIPIPPEKRSSKLEVRSIAPLFASAIKAIHDGSSVSHLFH